MNGLLAGMMCWTAAVCAAPESPATTETGFQKADRTLRVFGTDERQRIVDTKQMPWSAIGLVQAMWNRSGGLVLVSTGTGTLVSSRIVLTAGHVVYDQTDGWADEIVFIPGKNGSEEPFGRSLSVRSITQRAWVDNHDSSHDIALIVLNDPLGDTAGTLPVGVQPDQFFTNRNLNTAGYPGQTLPGNVQYHAYGTSTGLEDGLIRHTLDSEPGQSGSPVWEYNSSTQSRQIVGVLTGSREITSNGQVIDAYNVATRIDQAYADWIAETIAKYDVVAAEPAAAQPEPAAPEAQPQPVIQEESAAAPAPVCGAGAAISLAIGLTWLICRSAGSGRRRE